MIICMNMTNLINIFYLGALITCPLWPPAEPMPIQLSHKWRSTSHHPTYLQTIDLVPTLDGKGHPYFLTLVTSWRKELQSVFFDCSDRVRILLLHFYVCSNIWINFVMFAYVRCSRCPGRRSPRNQVRFNLCNFMYDFYSSRQTFIILYLNILIIKKFGSLCPRRMKHVWFIHSCQILSL